MLTLAQVKSVEKYVPRADVLAFMFVEERWIPVDYSRIQ